MRMGGDMLLLFRVCNRRMSEGNDKLLLLLGVCNWESPITQPPPIFLAVYLRLFLILRPKSTFIIVYLRLILPQTDEFTPTPTT